MSRASAQSSAANNNLIGVVLGKCRVESKKTAADSDSRLGSAFDGVFSVTSATVT